MPTAPPRGWPVPPWQLPSAMTPCPQWGQPPAACLQAHGHCHPWLAPLPASLEPVKHSWQLAGLQPTVPHQCPQPRFGRQASGDRLEQGRRGQAVGPVGGHNQVPGRRKRHIQPSFPGLVSCQGSGIGVWGQPRGNCTSPWARAEVTELPQHCRASSDMLSWRATRGTWDLVARVRPEPGGFQGLKHRQRKELELLLAPAPPQQTVVVVTAQPQTARGQGQEHLPTIHLACWQWRQEVPSSLGRPMQRSTSAQGSQPSHAPENLAPENLLASRWETETWLEGRA